MSHFNFANFARTSNLFTKSNYNAANVSYMVYNSNATNLQICELSSPEIKVFYSMNFLPKFYQYSVNKTSY